MLWPEWRMSVYYDVAESQVQILAILAKAETDKWLEQHGIPL